MIGTVIKRAPFPVRATGEYLTSLGIGAHCILYRPWNISIPGSKLVGNIPDRRVPSLTRIG